MSVFFFVDVVVVVVVVIFVTMVKLVMKANFVRV